MIDKIDLNANPIFRKSIMKLANTYKPNFSLDVKEFENEKVLFSEISKLICEDFSNQLYPILFDDLFNAFYKQYEDN